MLGYLNDTGLHWFMINPLKLYDATASSLNIIEVNNTSRDLRKLIVHKCAMTFWRRLSTHQKLHKVEPM